ncbi:MAG: hypothetical protein ACD_61C00308G0003 [uncultured bacterium]|uniref:O-antigen polymerase n=2 Tax=Microgenomates group TaxID=1794810 RepID=A0A0G1J749_9BACT|nr:MAG: hypothetical protein ACD_61C00308G0003 [uncultured bacterium]KKT30855.1 MAG: hypothetical protein UW16_C0004G0012 [Microgenomates group bacterium GW2011_GWC1_44_10]KKT48569.1 MAG: O-antigen polymerase [Candidatus Collierbacteria bacterium GW2011_GWC2_44_18]KKT67496.1 MAG: O-antigen polymerase [Candidatus Woesebacteria bacterium GW2011_GWA2_44_33]
MTYLLLILSLLVWPFGQLLAFSWYGLPFTIYLLDLSVFLLTISIFLHRESGKIVIRDPLFKPLMLFNLLALLSLLFNLRSLPSGGVVYALLYLVRLFIYPSIYFAVKLFPAKKIIRSVIFSFSFFCILGILQYLFFPDMRYLKQVGFDDHYFRLIGSLYDPNFSGVLFAGAALVLIYLGHWHVGVSLILFMALTFSRASYLCFSAGLFYLMVKRKQFSLILFLAGLLGIIWLTPKPFGEGVNLLRTFSIFSRFDSWSMGVELFLKKPIFGWGYNTLRSLTGARYQIDNSYLYVLATTGLLGLLAFINLIRRSFSGLTYSQRIFIFTILLHSLFNNSFFYIWINYSFWLVLALPLRAYKSK